MKNTNLKNLRLQAKLTQKKAAELIGVSERRWQRWEGGTCKMSQPLFNYFILKLDQLKNDHD